MALVKYKTSDWDYIAHDDFCIYKKQWISPLPGNGRNRALGSDNSQ